MDKKTTDITNILTENPELITIEIIEKINILKEQLLNEIGIKDEIVEILEDKVELEIISDNEQPERQKTLKELKEEIYKETIEEIQNEMGIIIS